MASKKGGGDPRKRNPWISAEDQRKAARKRHRKTDREDAEAAIRSRTEIPLTPEAQVVMADEAATKRIIATYQTFGTQQTIAMSLHQLVASSKSDAGLSKALENAGISLKNVECHADLLQLPHTGKAFQLLHGQENVGAILKAVVADPWAQRSTSNISVGENWSDNIILTITLTHTQKEVLRGYIAAKANAAGIAFP